MIPGGPGLGGTGTAPMRSFQLPVASIVANAATVHVKSFNPNIAVNPTIKLDGRELMKAIVQDQTSLGVLYEGLTAYEARIVTIRP